MDNKKIIDMKYTVDENGKPVSATVIYDDNTYKNVVNDPSQVIEWATQVARENPKENIRHIMRRASSEDALRRAKEGLYLFDIYVCDSDGNPIQQSADVSLANVDGTKYDYSLQRDENGDILCYRFEVKAGEYWYSVKIDGYVDDTAIVPMVVERDSSMTIRLGKTSGIIEY